MPIAPAYGASTSANSLLLSVQELPAGFTAIPASEMAGCQAQGDHGELAAFAFRQGSLSIASLCLSAFRITEQAANEAQATLMRQMIDTLLDNPQAMIDPSSAANSTEELTNIEVSTLTGIGDKATGFAKQTGIQQDETVLFRQGDYLASLTLHRETATSPIPDLASIAMQLDHHLQDYIQQNTQQYNTQQSTQQSG